MTKIGRSGSRARPRGRAGPAARLDLAVLYDQLFDLCLRLGDPATARRYNENSTELCRAILAGEPELWTVVYNLVRSYNNSGMLLYPMGRDPAGARAYHRKALELISRWVAADPTNAHAQQRLATTLYYEATCARQSGDRAGAAAGYRRCLEIREKLSTDPKAQVPQIDLMLAQARCEKHARASAIARNLIARSPDNAMICFQSACGFALSAGAVRDQASSTPAAIGVPRLGADPMPSSATTPPGRLTACVRPKPVGYADVVGLETDPDLEPIRNEPAFRADGRVPETAGAEALIPRNHGTNHSGTIRLPPAVILKTVVPPSDSPEPLVTPLETVIWPPSGNVSALVNLSVASLSFGL